MDPAAPENLYTVVTIPLNDIKNAYGLNVKTKKGGVIEESRYLGEPVIYSCDSVELYGLIDLPENTSYVFDVGQNQKTAVFIDGAGYWGKRLPKGLHRIRIKLSGNINMNLQVFWKYKGKRSPVDAKYLLMAKELYGIRADYMYFINQKDNFSAIEPVMISRVYWFNTEMKTEGKEGSYTILWSGYFNAGQEGEYTFNLESYKGFCSSILVNEYKCADYSGGETVVKSIRLAEGWHKIELKTYSYIDIPDASAFYYKLKVKKPEDDDFITVKYNEFKPYKPQ